MTLLEYYQEELKEKYFRKIFEKFINIDEKKPDENDEVESVKKFLSLHCISKMCNQVLKNSINQIDFEDLSKMTEKVKLILKDNKEEIFAYLEYLETRNFTDEDDNVSTKSSLDSICSLLKKNNISNTKPKKNSSLSLNLKENKLNFNHETAKNFILKLKTEIEFSLENMILQNTENDSKNSFLIFLNSIILFEENEFKVNSNLNIKKKYKKKTKN